MQIANRSLIVLLSLSLLANAYLLARQFSADAPAAAGSNEQSNQAKAGQVEAARAGGWPAVLGAGASQAESSGADWDRIRADLDYLFAAGDIGLAVEAALAERKDFAAAVELLLQEWTLALAAELDPAESQSLLRAERFLELVAANRYGQVDYQLLRAQWLYASEAYVAAFDLYYELLNSTEGQAQRALAEQLNVAVAELFKQLLERQQWQRGLAVIERLLWHEPNRGDYLLLQARINLALMQTVEARQALQLAVTLPDYRSRAAELLEAVTEAERGTTAHPLEVAAPGQFIAPVVVDGSARLRLLIDTGATLSVLDQAAFNKLERQLDAEYVESAQFRTAGGTVEAAIYRFESLALGDHRVGPIEFAVMELQGAGASDGLLGMNYLSRFRFQIDQDRRELLLQARP